jgi:hypothetical protein
MLFDANLLSYLGRAWLIIFISIDASFFIFSKKIHFTALILLLRATPRGACHFELILSHGTSQNLYCCVIWYYFALSHLRSLPLICFSQIISWAPISAISRQYARLCAATDMFWGFHICLYFLFTLLCAIRLLEHIRFRHRLSIAPLPLYLASTKRRLRLHRLATF